ncbi:MAG TPA: phage holin family protein [Streptosporangiaceae bacterium]
MAGTNGNAQPAVAQEAPAGEPVRQFSEQVSRLIRDELKLAEYEMTRKAALLGKSQASKATPPVPEQTVQSVRADVEEIRERAHR